MLLIRLLRYIQGYVVFRAQGGFPERFINLCTRNRIPLWNINNIGSFLTAETAVNCFDDIKAVAEKSGMETQIIKTSSLRDSLKKHKSRKWLLICLAFCIALTVFLSFFIWSVSVEGNDKYTNEEILSVFENEGIKIGVLKAGIDTRKISENAVSALPGLSWAKVNIRGCLAVIEVRERDKKPDMLDESKPVNIVAKTDGQIMKYEVSKGAEILKPGIAVTKGELLVSGVIENSDGSERLVHSLAKVTAKVTHKIKSEKVNKLYSLSDEKIKSSVFFFGLTVPFYRNTENAFESRTYLDSNNKRLPAGIFRYRAAEYGNETELTEEKEELICAFGFNIKAKDICENAEKVLKSKTVKSTNDISGEFICEEDIGKESEILISDN